MTAAERIPAGLGQVVAGVDGSETARYAARWAGREAEARSLPLTVLYALGLTTETLAPAFGPGSREHTDSAAEQLVESVAAPIRRAHPGVPVETEIYPGPAVQRLAELSGEGTLTVTGTRGHGALAGMLLGSVSRAMATHARGPLVVVRSPRDDAADPVVLGVGPEPDEAAIGFAFDAAQRYGVGLTAVRAVTPQPVFTGDIDLPALMPAGQGIRSTVPPIVGDLREDREQVIARETGSVRAAVDWAARRYPRVPVGVAVLEGDAPEILAAVGEPARLVVIGAPSSRHRRVLPATPGHVVTRLLAHCPAPIALVPGAGE